MPAIFVQSSSNLFFPFLAFSATSPNKTPQTHLPNSIPCFTPTMSGLELEQKQPPPPAPAPETDVEGGESAGAAASGFGVGSVLRRWRRVDMMRKGSVVMRAMGFVFSLLSFIITASNNHGDGRQFSDYEEYRYLLAIAILSTLYTGGQCYRHFHKSYYGKELLPLNTAALIDFVGDQVTAYLLLSSASSAIPMTNKFREGGDNIFTDSSSAAISMSLLAFLVLACSSIIAGYKLSTQSQL